MSAKLPKLKREDLRPKGEDYPIINVSTLTRFNVFVDEVMRSSRPVTFRSFMKHRGSHRTMITTVDALEDLSGQILLRREILDDDNTRTGRFVTSKADALKVRSKRVEGMTAADVTEHGEVWSLLGDLVVDLILIAKQDDTDPAKIAKDFRNLQDYLDDYVKAKK